MWCKVFIECHRNKPYPVRYRIKIPLDQFSWCMDLMCSLGTRAARMAEPESSGSRLANWMRRVPIPAISNLTGDISPFVCLYSLVSFVVCKMSCTKVESVNFINNYRRVPSICIISTEPSATCNSVIFESVFSRAGGFKAAGQSAPTFAHGEDKYSWLLIVVCLGKRTLYKVTHWSTKRALH
jgi:hypothetical protein